MNPRPAAMPETASAAATARQHRGVIPEEIIIWEILPRLPARAVLRCRAVCRSWRRALTFKSNSDFLLAHHRLQPSLPIASCVQYARHDLRAVSPRPGTAAALSPVATLRHPGLQVRASCDGLLVLSLSQANFYVCNPSTRQWVLQPFFPHFLGFYPHRPSGEYRILYGTGPPGNPRSGHKASYSVFTLGSGKRRGIGRPAASASEEKALGEGVVSTAPDRPSVLLRGSLHFYPVKKQTSSSNMVMVFSTTAESFRWMSAPAVPASATLFEMDGKLGLSSISDNVMAVDICVLQDYESETWELKYRVKLPVVEMSLSAACRHFMSVVFLSEEGGVLVSNFSRLVHADVEGKLLSDFQYREQSLLVVPYKLKESLLRHAFFPIRRVEEANASLSPFM